LIVVEHDKCCLWFAKHSMLFNVMIDQQRIQSYYFWKPFLKIWMLVLFKCIFEIGWIHLGGCCWPSTPMNLGLSRYIIAMLHTCLLNYLDYINHFAIVTNHYAKHSCILCAQKLECIITYSWMLGAICKTFYVVKCYDWCYNWIHHKFT